MSCRRKKRTKRSGHPGRASHLTLVGTPSAADTALQLRFHAWYQQHAADLDDHAPPESMRALTTLLFELAADHGFSLGQPTLAVLEKIINLVAAEEDLDDLHGAVLNVLDHYLDFLEDTGSWTGTTRDFAHSSELVLGLIADLIDEDDEEDILPVLLRELDTLPEVPFADQLVALNTMTPIAGVSGLLDWIGAGKPVTSTGALRLADIEPVAALLEIRAVGQRGAPQPMPELSEIFEDAVASTGEREPIALGTMWDLEGLRSAGNLATRDGLS